MNSLRFRKSLTKNWPSGRRNATVMQDPDDKHSFRIWNHSLTNFKKPYLVTAEPATDAADEGLLSS